MLANLKKNRNIKANDVNLISMARSTEVCFKTSYVCFCAYDRLYIAFSVLFMVCHPLEKYFPMTPPPPPPPELTAFESRLPLGISNVLLWGGGGGGMDIFWNHTFVFAISCLHHSFTSKPNFFMCLRVQRCKESQFYSRPFAQL